MAKKIGHKYYGIKRKDIEINSVSNIMYNTNNNYNKYKIKILTIINDKDINQLSFHLFCRPNCILSMINFEDDECGGGPYLYYVNESNSYKMSSLFLDCLFHFGEILLNEKKPLNCNIGCYNDFEKNKINSILSNQKVFVQKYLNFSLGDEPSIGTLKFVKYI